MVGAGNVPARSQQSIQLVRNMTKYKIGKLDHPVLLSPGDTFKLTHTQIDKKNTNTTLLHTEEITKTIECTHYAVLSTPFSMGMMIGTAELENFLEDAFPGCQIGENEPIL
jgi:hypothetical protein